MKRSLTPLHPLSLALLLALPVHALAQHAHHAMSQEAAPQATSNADDHAHHMQAGEDPHAGHDMAMPMTPASSQPMDHTQHAQHHASASTSTNTPLPREPIPAITAADRAAAFPHVDAHAMEHASPINFYVQMDRLEAWDANPGSGQAWQTHAWIGSDLNRVWLRSEGEREQGRTQSANLEMLYGRSVSPWWDVVVGVRQDFQPGDARSRLAFGVQGLAPYKFEVAVTGYLADSGQLTVKAEAEYELLLTNRLILQPHVETEWASRAEAGQRQGSGLNSVEASLRLRYEITRRVAPYVGVSHERMFGDTADWQVQAGEHRRDTRVVAGLRFWF